MLVAFGFVAMLCAAGPAAAEPQGSRCAACHFENFFDVPQPFRLGEWEQSAHARHGVGCEKCHGGDPTTTHRVEAHRGVISSHNPGSGVAPANLPLTCGQCHTGPRRAFSHSRHDQLLQQGDPRAPTCSTCHGAMTALLLSPSTLEAQCARCHAAGSPGPPYPQLARDRIEQADRLEAVLGRTETLILRIRDMDRRQRLLVEYAMAKAALREAADAVHAFDLGAWSERLQHAQRQVDDLALDVTNPVR